MPTVSLTGAPATIDQVVQVARMDAPVALGDDARRNMLASRKVLEAYLSDGLAHYGINTGFGSLSRTRVGADELRDLQRNLIRSHAAGVSDPLPTEIVRATMFLLAGSLARGKSGVRPEVVTLLIEMLNRGVTPVVPSVGSVGASGDLAPLAAIAMALIGEGDATYAGSTLPSGKILPSLGLAPITLEAKEGLALINGTHLMAGTGALLVHDMDRLFASAVGAAAMAIDAVRASHSFLDPRVHAARNQPAQAEVAARVLGMLKGSQIVESHKVNDPRVQDPYCLRCIPQVLGGTWGCLGYVKRQIEQELGAVTDNPLVFADAKAEDALVSAGNFHGMPLAIPLDCAAIAVSHIAGISERRTFWMLSAFDAEAHLPPYLAKKPGVHSGLMIAQYTAAACCNEIITLCTPASPSNIVTSAGIEDYNSFGPRSAMKARRATELARYVVATELLCAAEALEYHRPLRSGEGVEKLHAAVRNVIEPLTGDRPPGPDISMVAEAIADGAFG
ncbi:MAG TPA: histidine ammonia-lyase [Phycisphaerales bacterium]|nr:histidine ammonia-lyase [Phycisphaerales bacterium]